MAETGGKIYQAIPAIMGQINAVGKNKRNTQQNFMYRGIDDVMNAINPALVKNGVFIVPEVMEQTREERQTAKGSNLIYSICRMRFRFFADDGSSVEAVTIGEGMDSGDKATNKAMATAFKYACFQIFCIPTEEMKDPDAECHDVQPGGNSSDGAADRRNSGTQGNNGSKQRSGSQGTTRSQTVSDAQADARMVEEGNKALIDGTKVKVLREAIQKKGLAETSILGHYNRGKFEDMTMADWTNAMKILERYPDQEGRK